MTPNERTSPLVSAITTAIVSACTSRPTKRTLDMRPTPFVCGSAPLDLPLRSVIRAYCHSAVGRSIVTNPRLDRESSSHQQFAAMFTCCRACSRVTMTRRTGAGRGVRDLFGRRLALDREEAPAAFKARRGLHVGLETDNLAGLEQVPAG